jgi:hypothetical protein
VAGVSQKAEGRPRSHDTPSRTLARGVSLACQLGTKEKQRTRRLQFAMGGSRSADGMPFVLLSEVWRVTALSVCAPLLNVPRC